MHQLRSLQRGGDFLHARGRLHFLLPLLLLLVNSGHRGLLRGCSRGSLGLLLQPFLLHIHGLVQRLDRRVRRLEVAAHGVGSNGRVVELDLGVGGVDVGEEVAGVGVLVKAQVVVVEEGVVLNLGGVETLGLVIGHKLGRWLLQEVGQVALLSVLLQFVLGLALHEGGRSLLLFLAHVLLVIQFGWVARPLVRKQLLHLLMHVRRG